MKIEDAKTLLRIYQDAVNVQDACNLSGVVHSFSKHITDLRKLENPGSTDDLNCHPVCFMFSYKIAALNGHEPLTLGFAYDAAQNKCLDKAKELEAFIAAYTEADEIADEDLEAAADCYDRLTDNSDTLVGKDEHDPTL